jgi:predicted O-methyltransferase YrrM
MRPQLIRSRTNFMLAVGMITCHRPGIDVHEAIEQLRRGGFDEPVHLFCEPGTPEIRPLPEVVVHHNPTRLGVLGNWKHCLAWLVGHTTADHLLVCEDDVAYARSARRVWERALGTFDRVGFWSLYTPQRDGHIVGRTTGWVAANRGRDAWGTQAMCFPRASAEHLLQYEPLHTENQLRGPTDAIVAQCFRVAGLPCYYHNPSLADHLGRISSIGHTWHDEHTGLNFDRNYEPADDPEDGSPTTPPAVTAARVPSERAAVVTVYQSNISQEVVARQADVVCRFLPPGCAFEPRRVSNHALGLNDYFRDLRHDVYLVLDIDCIPLTPWAVPWVLESARAGIVIGAAQRANHIDNGGHLYAGPCALAFSRTTFERLGRPSFKDTSRGDVAEEVTYRCEEVGVPVSLLWPTHVTTPKWALRGGIEFGNGTTYGGAFYHAFEISKGHTAGMFLDKCREVLSQGPEGAPSPRPLLGPTGASPRPIRPTFHEQWYAESELALLEGAVRFIRPLQGEIIELGCWEGRSTAVIANACHPETVLAVDTWRGSFSEGAEHETVRLARTRDVFAIFQENMRVLCRGNVVAKRLDVTEFLRQQTAPIKFCHIDAAHDYPSVRDALERLLPRLVRGGILIGHDYQTAHAGRSDLQGGVQRAVRELLPRHAVRGNNWWYVHLTQ